MADELLTKAQDIFEGQIDFEGQKQTEWISTVLIVVTGIISFLAGYVKQDVYLSLFVGLGGALVTFLVVVPAWPAYNQHPEKWLSTSTPQATITSGTKPGTNTIMFDGQMLTI